MQDIIEAMDPDAAARAFEAMQPQLDAQTEIKRSNTSIDKAIIHAASVGRMVKQPEMRARFGTLPAGEFDQQHVERLETVSLATWHTLVSHESASTQTSGAKIAEFAIDDGKDYRYRMAKVLDYHVGHKEEVAAELAAIRDSTGYLAMAKGLIRLCRLFEIHDAEIRDDRRHFRATDREEAGKLAHAILQVLGDGRDTDARYWSGYLTRSWSLLVVTYGEVSAAGRWLFRHENGEARFPSLYTIGRQRRSRRPGEDAGDGVENPEPGEPGVEPDEPDTEPVQG
jgi:hypothetical protein